MYKLTDEGKKYLEEGLPEKRLLDILKKGEVSVEEINRELEESSIAISWALKKGWIEIENGTVKLKKAPKNIALQKSLKKVASEEKISEELKMDLIERTLIEEVREDIVKQAQRQLEQGKISNLTPQLIKSGLWREADFKEYDPTKTGKKESPGRKHLLSYYTQEVRRVFLDMGFEEMKGSFV